MNKKCRNLTTHSKCFKWNIKRKTHLLLIFSAVSWIYIKIQRMHDKLKR